MIATEVGSAVRSVRDQFAGLGKEDLLSLALVLVWAGIGWAIGHNLASTSHGR